MIELSDKYTKQACVYVSRLRYRTKCHVDAYVVHDVGWLSSTEVEHDCRCHRMSNITNLIVASLFFDVVDRFNSIMVCHLCETEVPELLLILVWVKGLVLPCILVASEVAEPHVVPCHSSYQSRSLVRCIDNPCNR